MSLYQLIAPEMHELDHDLHIYRGYQELGVESLREALDAGFVQLLAENDAPPTLQEEALPEGGLFLHEDALPTLETLIARVASLRRNTSQGTSDEPEAPAAPSEAPEPSEEPDAAIPDDPAEVLEAPSDTAALFAATSPEAIAANMRQRWGLLDREAIAQEVLGDEDADAAPREDLLGMQYRAVLASFEGLAPSASDEAAKAAIETHYREELARYQQSSEDQQQQRQQASSLQRRFREEFLPAWRSQGEAYRARLKASIEALPETGQADEQLQGQDERLKLSLEHLLTRSIGQAQRFVREYTGEIPLDAAIQQLEAGWSESLEKAEALLQHVQQQATFRDAYKGKSSYQSHFALARKIRRKLYFFCGPTNSGKTYAAFEELCKSDSGVYLAPLRLLALEGQQKLLERGVRASFLTGEERDVRKGAKFVASTIEMLNTEKAVGCAIIDEAQLLGHPQRGWAWVQALVGAPAYHVILTGAPHALPAIRQIAAALQEPLEVREFTRFNQLQIEREPASLGELTPGTAVICFSRRDVLSLKREIEATTSLRAAVIYGALSPDVRRSEARYFREGRADVLVATDAIGMGLNLPIQRVLFWRTEKVSQGIPRALTTEEIQQIAGRAGRYGLAEEGRVGAFTEDDLERITEGLSAQPEPLSGPYHASPNPGLLGLLSEAHQTESLPQLLDHFQHDVWFDEGLLIPMVPPATKQLAAILEEPLEGCPLRTKFTFSRAPINPRHERLVQELVAFARAFAQGEQPALSPRIVQPYLKAHTHHPHVLQDAEQQVQLLTLYRWLAYRFPLQFKHADNADNYRHILNRYISRSLHTRSS